MRTLVEMLARRVREEPERVAFTFLERATTFGRLGRWSDAFAARLLAAGVGPGERVVVALPNGEEFFAAFYGILEAGAVAVPVFPGEGYRRALGIAGLCTARALVVPSGLEEGEAAEVWTQARRRGLVVLDTGIGHGEDTPLRLPEVAPDDVAFIQYTSGSTGDPKGVELTHANLLANVGQLIAGMGITRDEVFVSWLPVYHDMGLILKTLVPFYLPATLVLLPTRLANVAPWLEAIERWRGTFTAAPDFAWRLCLRAVRDPEAHDLSSLRVALNAAEPVRADTIARFHRAFGLGEVMVAGYGLAEATVGVAMAPPGRPARVDGRGFVSVGPPFPGVEVAILGEAGELAGRGEVGEILVRGAATTRGYHANPGATAGLFWRGGFVRTGDLGYLDGDGELFIVGRKKSIILHAGQNVSPQEVEEEVDALPFVRTSAAVGVDRGGPAGEQVYVFAEVRPRSPGGRREGVGRGEGGRRREPAEMAAEIVRRFHSRLGFRPGRVYLLKPRTIPRTPNGKIQHPLLRQHYLAGTLRREGRILYPPY